MKTVLLAGAAMFASPLLAQDMKTPDTTTMSSPATEQTASPSTATTPANDSTAPAETAANPQAATETAQAPANTATPAASQVAAVIDADFGKYDADKDGNLSKTEFGAWMVALKTASDPNTKAESPEVATWVGQAFAQADVDKSAAVSKPELNKFLAPQAG